MSPVSARPNLLTRLVLTEPARLYLWPLVFLAVFAGLTGGVVTGQWSPWLPGGIAAALLLLAATEAVRASAYCQASHLGEMIASRGSWAIPTPERDAL